MNLMIRRKARPRPSVVLVINTGICRGELLNLLREKVDFSRNVIHMTNTQRKRSDRTYESTGVAGVVKDRFAK
jgi:integrase